VKFQRGFPPNFHFVSKTRRSFPFLVLNEQKENRSFRDPYEVSKKFYLIELLSVIAQMLDLEGAGGRGRFNKLNNFLTKLRQFVEFSCSAVRSRAVSGWVRCQRETRSDDS
jgi:hypothetical protein